MDGGIDDALALILALRSREIDVVGITAVSGNVPVRQATMNALRVVELLNRADVWVAVGSARPLVRNPIRAYSFHGKDGLGDSNMPSPKIRPADKDAIFMIQETLSSAKKRELTIVCTGPLTNLATLLRDFPEAERVINEIVIMGGAFGVTGHGIGNETPVAEFNIFSDPEAAKIVFEADTRLKAVGLDVTTIPELELTKNDYARLRKKNDRVAIFATRILKYNFRAHKHFTLHDPMAVGVTVRPSLYSFSEYRVSIEVRGEYTAGMTVADRRHSLPQDQLIGKPVLVCNDVDPRFKQLFLQRMTADWRSKNGPMRLFEQKV